jgi:hypothetical protein
VSGIAERLGLAPGWRAQQKAKGRKGKGGVFTKFTPGRSRISTLVALAAAAVLRLLGEKWHGDKSNAKATANSPSKQAELHERERESRCHK